MPQIFLDIGVVLALASILGIFAHKLKQPILIGYIFAGILAGFFGFFNQDSSRHLLDFLAVFGITFLLFLVGLELRFSEIRTYGFVALATGIGQIIFTSLIGFGLILLLGFSTTEAFYIALALTFSSTIIIVKLLTEKRDLDSLYGKITVGFLLVQDAVAILALILVTAVGSGGLSPGSFLFVIFKALLLAGAVLVASKTVVPFFVSKANHSLEVLFVSSVTWAVLISALALYLGLSIEIGAFLAGVSLANLKEESQIASRIRPLRDLFLVFFFVLLGLSLTFSNILALGFPILALSLFILIGNPLIVMVIMGFLGFRKRTAFLASVTVAQISEFSLVLVALGKSVGDLDQNVVDMVTAIGLLTILGSSYLVMYSSSIYRKIDKYLSIFERKKPVEQIKFDEKEFTDHVVLIGAGRLGWEILKQLQKQDFKTLVVEFNPTIAAVLRDREIDFLFGDISDPDIFEGAALNKAKLIISTVFDSGDTSELLHNLGSLEKKPLIFVTGADRESALKFYELGADYVIVPRILSGHQVAHLLTAEKLASFEEGKLRNEHMEDLREDINPFS